MSIFDKVKKSLFVDKDPTSTGFLDVAREVPSKLKTLASGRGVLKLFRDTPAPETFKQATIEANQKLFGSQEAIASTAFNFIGGMKNLGNIVPKGKIIDAGKESIKKSILPAVNKAKTK